MMVDGRTYELDSTTTTTQTDLDYNELGQLENYTNVTIADAAPERATTVFMSNIIYDIKGRMIDYDQNTVERASNTYDLDGSGMLDQGDLDVLAEYLVNNADANIGWGYTRIDINHDGIVNMDDIHFMEDALRPFDEGGFDLDGNGYIDDMDKQMFGRNLMAIISERANVQGPEGVNPAQAGWDPRFDLTGDNKIDLADLEEASRRIIEIKALLIDKSKDIDYLALSTSGKYDLSYSGGGYDLNNDGYISADDIKTFFRIVTDDSGAQVPYYEYQIRKMIDTAASGLKSNIMPLYVIMGDDLLVENPYLEKLAEKINQVIASSFSSDYGGEVSALDISQTFDSNNNGVLDVADVYNLWNDWRKGNFALPGDPNDTVDAGFKGIYAMELAKYLGGVDTSGSQKTANGVVTGLLDRSYSFKQGTVDFMALLASTGQAASAVTLGNTEYVNLLNKFKYFTNIAAYDSDSTGTITGTADKNAFSAIIKDLLYKSGMILQGDPAYIQSLDINGDAMISKADEDVFGAVINLIGQYDKNGDNKIDAVDMGTTLNPVSGSDNKSFELPSTISTSYSLTGKTIKVMVNGLLRTTGYTSTGRIVTFTTALAAGETVTVSFENSAEIDGFINTYAPTSKVVNKTTMLANKLLVQPALRANGSLGSDEAGYLLLYDRNNNTVIDNEDITVNNGIIDQLLAWNGNSAISNDKFVTWAASSSIFSQLHSKGYDIGGDGVMFVDPKISPYSLSVGGETYIFTYADDIAWANITQNRFRIRVPEKYLYLAEIPDSFIRNNPIFVNLTDINQLNTYQYGTGATKIITQKDIDLLKKDQSKRLMGEALEDYLNGDTNIGTGNGVNKEFIFDKYSLVGKTFEVYVGGDKKARNSDYTINEATGAIVFSSNSAPALDEAVKVRVAGTTNFHLGIILENDAQSMRFLNSQTADYITLASSQPTSSTIPGGSLSGLDISAAGGMVEAWVQFINLTKDGTQTILSQADNGDGHAVWLRYENKADPAVSGKLIFTFHGITAELNVKFDQIDWHHIAAAYNPANGKIKFFIDGIEYAAVAQRGSLVTYSGYLNKNITIGADVAGGVAKDGLKGYIDELAIYSSGAFTLSNIKSHMNKREPDPKSLVI
ncbi:MAG: LamG domain-containing protein, partial [Candidatus Omnitrophica bacterium]|nr:LamG domain-containing protein [Candidatus Omnitrophota bacterium]